LTARRKTADVSKKTASRPLSYPTYMPAKNAAEDQNKILFMSAPFYYTLAHFGRGVKKNKFFVFNRRVFLQAAAVRAEPRAEGVGKPSRKDRRSSVSSIGRRNLKRCGESVQRSRRRRAFPLE
jgi:hypothetical protein